MEKISPRTLIEKVYPILKILDSVLASSKSSSSSSRSSSRSSSSSSSKRNHMLINKIKELASDAIAVLSQNNQELLQPTRDAITKHFRREYKTLKQNVLPDTKLSFGDDLNKRMGSLQVGNQSCKVNITSRNSRYYQTYNLNFSQNQINSKNFKGFLRRIISTKSSRSK